MWIANLSYWGFNQYIIQRALAAKNLAEAQKGVVFAAFLKLLMPVDHRAAGHRRGDAGARPRPSPIRPIRR